MFISMNNFGVDSARTVEFATAWRERASFLAGITWISRVRLGGVL
jgi:hypothetical protein